MLNRITKCWFFMTNEVNPVCNSWSHESIYNSWVQSLFRFKRLWLYWAVLNWEYANILIKEGTRKTNDVCISMHNNHLKVQFVRHGQNFNFSFCNASSCCSPGLTSILSVADAPWTTHACRLTAGKCPTSIGSIESWVYCGGHNEFTVVRSWDLGKLFSRIVA